MRIQSRASLKAAGNVSPSPGGEGRDEGGRNRFDAVNQFYGTCFPVALKTIPFNLNHSIMKTFSLTLALVVLAAWTARAQVSVQLATDQDEFLPGESVPLAVKITNASGQLMHFGDDASWLTFNVESADGFIVERNSPVPVTGPFDLESSQMATKYVDIAPYFIISRPGRYQVTATLAVKQWSTEVSSKPKTFDVISGVKLWSQDFGVPTAAGVPEMRRFTLEEANFLREQLRLYVQLSDISESHLYRVFALGPMVSFGQPEQQVDRLSRLHVLWQTGAQTFSYALVGADGTLLQQDTYDNFNSRPHLTVDDSGNVTVTGGTRRAKAGDVPSVKMPDQLPSLMPSAPPAK